MGATLRCSRGPSGYPVDRCPSTLQRKMDASLPREVVAREEQPIAGVQPFAIAAAIGQGILPPLQIRPGRPPQLLLDQPRNELGCALFNLTRSVVPVLAAP